ncbi:BTB/POZ domain-containing protein 6-like [Contarinia nasturtii]|uniref:BTB/POZ domain-containing protein 6-like n=1 Tax=Contarinia nasturtii TaxID=265458 RepID=UPI0012D3BE82|nr:BTB/POZ domain-containing protein 6-like [Contarinia nasturtii]
MANQLHTTNNSIVTNTTGILYLERNETGDVVFHVESEEIRAHRCVMAAISPKYKIQFYGPRPDEGDIHVDDVSASAFKEFLQFFYLEEVSMTEENIADVLNLAKQSLVDEFVEKSINYLNELILNMGNVCKVYGLAILHDLKNLKEKCEQLILDNAKKLFVTTGFIECDYSVLTSILKMNALRCKEIDVFNACIDWAHAACKRINIDAENTKNLRTILKDAIYLIRFSSMTYNEFDAISRDYHGFFTPDESIEISYIVNKQNFKSQKFNQLLRHQNEIVFKNICLSINLNAFKQLSRISKFQSNSSYINTHASIKFCCNKKILLKQFTMDLTTEYPEKLEKNAVALIEIDTEWKPINVNCFELREQFGYRFLVEFEEFIQIEPKANVHIQMPLHRLANSRTNIYLWDRIETKDICFDFKPSIYNSNPNVGYITELFYFIA